MPEYKASRLQSVVMRCQDPENPAQEYLVCRIQIACQACGGVIDYNVIGHHLPAVIRALTKAMEMYPDLCRETVTEIPAGSTLIIPPGGGRTM